MPMFYGTPVATATVIGKSKLAKDIVTTAPITVNGGASLDNVLPGEDADVTLALTQNLPGINRFLRGSFNPQNRYAIDPNICLMPTAKAALTITSLVFTCDADPTGEFDADLNKADAFIGKANATKLADITTTAGAYASGAITLALASGKTLYLTLSDPDDNIKEVAYEITYDFD
jgi:hypothetical protein